MSANKPLGQMIIGLGLDSANFSRGMKGVNQQIKSSMTEMKAHLNVMGRSGKEIDILKVKQTGLTSVITAQNEKISLAKEKYDACREAIEENADATQGQKDALIKAQQEYVKAIGELGSFENQLKEVSIKLTAMESGLYKNGEALISFGGNMSRIGETASKVGKSLMLGITTPIIAIGTYAVKTTADFDEAMSKVSAVSGAVGEDFLKLREKAREMGEKTKFSATEAAEAMNYMAMAGWKTEDMLSGVEGIMNLAAASGEGLAMTSDIVTDALTGFGKSAGDSARLADIMAAAASNSNTDVAMMGETFKYCTPIAGALGFSMEETAEAIGLMANSGIKASMAGTAMRSMMNNLAGEIKFTGDAFGEMTIESQETDGSMRGLNEILSECRSAFTMMTEAERVANAEALVGKNGMSGFLAVMNAAPSDIEKLNIAIAESSGVASEMSEIMQDNLSGQITILKSQTEELAISFGDLLMPKIREIVSGVQETVDKLNKMDDGTKNTILNVALFTATVGPAVFIVGKLISGIGTLATGIGKGMQSFSMWAASITQTTALTVAQTTAIEANTTSLLAKTAKTLADTAASRVHAAAERTKSIAVAAGNGTLTAQVIAMNTSIVAKGKDTAATVAHTIAEKTRTLSIGASATGLSLQTIATIAQTTASSACAVATGVLSAAINLLLGPVGWVIAGITLLVSGVIAAVKWMNKDTEASKKLKEETEQLAQASDALTDTLGNNKSMYEDGVKSIKAEAGAAKTLAEKVTNLSKIENKSAAQKKELQTYVGILNDSMEGLNIQYDIQADALSVTTDQIYSQISALEKQAETQAAQERMTEILKEQMSVNEQMTELQKKITEATENDTLKNKERKTILEELTDQEIQLKGELESLGASYSYVTGIIIEASAVESEAVVENTQTILEAYGSVATAYEDLGSQQQQAIDGIVGTYETMSGRLSDLSEKIKLDSETTWKEVQKNQADTIEKTKEFSGLYAELIEAGVSESYLKAIGATGPESIPLLKEMIAKGTDTVLESQDQWQDAYNVIGDTLVNSLEMDDSVRGAIKEYVLGETGIYGTLQGAITDADLNALGKNLTDGVSKGILNNVDGLKDSAKTMADDTTDAAEDAWGIQSPSKVFAELGKYLMQGLVQGISKNEVTVYAKATEVANNLTKVMKKSLDIQSPSRVMRDQVGKNIALGIAEGITRNKSYAKKSAEDIADAVLQSAKTKLENEKVYTELSMADEIAYWDNVRKQVKSGTQAKIDADKQYFQSKKSLNQKMESLESDYSSKVKKIHEDLDKNIQSLQDSYASKMTSRTKSIMDSMGLFDRFSASTKLSTTDLLGNLKSQVNGLNDWSNNLKTLEKRGLGSDMIESLRGMGTGAAGEIALMTEMTDEELREYKNLWKEKQRLARKEASKELEPMLEETERQIEEMKIVASKGLEEYKQEFLSAMSEIGIQIQEPLDQIQSSLQNTMISIVKIASGTVSEESGKTENINGFKQLATSVVQASATLPVEFVSIGQSVVTGMIQGIGNKTSDLMETMTAVVRSAINAAKEEAQIHSPSRVMMSLGSYMIQGFGIGMEHMQGYIEGVAGDSANAVGKAFKINLNNDEMMSVGLKATLPNFSNILNEKTGTIKLIYDALDILEMKQRQESEHEKDESDTLLKQLIQSNQQMVKLLQIIAEKNLVIDKTSFTSAMDAELGMMGTLKIRGA